MMASNTHYGASRLHEAQSFVRKMQKHFDITYDQFMSWIDSLNKQKGTRTRISSNRLMIYFDGHRIAVEPWNEYIRFIGKDTFMDQMLVPHESTYGCKWYGGDTWFFESRFIITSRSDGNHVRDIWIDESFNEDDADRDYVDVGMDYQEIFVGMVSRWKSLARAKKPSK